ncbi:MAG: hypothetical protein RLZZ367_725 [Bacteroidota bacterium]
MLYNPYFLLNRPYFSSMDTLSYILDSIKLKGVVYQKTHFTKPWGVAVAQDDNSQFWRVLKGSCYIKIPGRRIIKVNEGDFVFVPHGSGHLISGEPNSICVPSAQYVASLRSGKPMFLNGDRQHETILIGGHFEFTDANRHPFFKSLPDVIRLDNKQMALSTWMQNVGAFMNEELVANRAGANIILGRLAEIIFILIIRAYLQQANIKKGVLLAVKHPRISASLQIMHQQYEKDFKLQHLAQQVGMSRSLYCKVFKNLVGETPLAYLTGWRVLRAQQLLTESNDNISVIAAKVGYQSEAAFNRVFKATTGHTPARFRRSVANS